jgi:hypothetical protein
LQCDLTLAFGLPSPTERGKITENRATIFRTMHYAVKAGGLYFKDKTSQLPDGNRDQPSHGGFAQIPIPIGTSPCGPGRRIIEMN